MKKIENKIKIKKNLMKKNEKKKNLNKYL